MVNGGVDLLVEEGIEFFVDVFTKLIDLTVGYLLGHFNSRMVLRLCEIYYIYFYGILHCGLNAVKGINYRSSLILI